MLFCDTDAGATEMKEKVEQMNDKFDILLDKVANLHVTPYSARWKAMLVCPSRCASQEAEDTNRRRESTSRV